MINYYKAFKWLLLVFFLSLFLLACLRFPLTYSFNNNINLNYYDDQYYPQHIKDSILVFVEQYVGSPDSINEDINIGLLEDLLIQKEYIKKAEVYLSVIGSLNIFVSFREPFFRFLIDDKAYYCDFEGVFLPESLQVDKKLLVVSGNLEGTVDLMDLIAVIYDDIVLKDLIGGIHYKNNNYIMSSTICDLGIIVRENTILNKSKIDMILGFYNFLLENHNCDYCNIIDARYSNQIICIN